MDLIETATQIRALAPDSLRRLADDLVLGGATVDEAREALAEARARDLFETFNVCRGDE